MTKDTRTVAILATPPGVGGVAVVRVSGREAYAIVETLFRPSVFNNQESERKPFDRLFSNARVRHGLFRCGDEVIDEVLVSAAPGGSPCAIDICTHGGVRIVERVLQALESLGASLVTGDQASHIAWPAANRIEQEAVLALTQALTERAVRFLAWQRSHLVSALKEIESRVEEDPDDAYSRLEHFHQRYASTEFLLKGATIALVGPPNSGKSTLFNQLVGRDATIVSPLAGTTRDWVTATFELEGIRLTLVDTAGEHPSSDALETAAMTAGKKRVLDADLCILVLDGSEPITDAAQALFAARSSYRRCLTVANKRDIGTSLQLNGAAEPLLAVSAKTGEGVKDLQESISRILEFADFADFQPSAFTFRQYSIVRDSLVDRSSSSQELKVAIKRLIFGS